MRRLHLISIAAVAASALACLAGTAGAATGRPPRLVNWAEFGLTPQRGSSTADVTGINSVNVKRLHRRTVSLPGTVDSAPDYLHSVRIGARARSVAFVDTSYGRVIALDVNSGRILWTFTPSGYRTWVHTARITQSSPLIDPDHRFIYAAAPDGRIHKVEIDSGREVRSGAWPARVTRDPLHEKLTPSLNLVGPYLIAGTGGFVGDIPPYQGHVVLIDRATGRVRSVFNALCANKHYLQVPSACPQWGAAILSRGGAVVERGGRRILITTGNALYNGTTMFGDSLVELSVPDLRITQVFTPINTAELDEMDLDLGSASPAIVGRNRVLLGGKDRRLRLLVLDRLDGKAPPLSGAWPVGGQLQRLKFNGGVFTQPAVVHEGGTLGVAIGAEGETATYTLSGGLLHQDWELPTSGSSPVYAGGLLYVYRPDEGGIGVYRFGSPLPLTVLPGGPGHWNSPIVVDGHVLEPEGDANAHRATGTMDIFSVR